MRTPPVLRLTAIIAVTLLAVFAVIQAHADVLAAGTGSVSGRVRLEGRNHHDGVYVTLDGGASAPVETGADGRFTFNNVPLGTHVLRLDMPGYLAVEGQFQSTQSTTVLGDLTMTGGDAYGDQVIDIFDLTLVARAYDSQPPSDPHADLNADGRVDLLDLVLVTQNYDKRGPTGGQTKALTLLPPALSKVQQERPVQIAREPGPNDPTAQWTLSPAKDTYAVGDVVTATLTLSNAAGVYGAEVRQAYNAKQLRPTTASPLPTQEGALFAQDALTPRNSAANGTIFVQAAQVGEADRPAEGVLAQVPFQVIGCGETTLDTKGVRLTDGKGGAIPFNAGAPVTLTTPCK
ncbi:MAG: carboxypeptidase regulatory-like domain-containing protein [Anaerolineae bacterium]